MIARLAGRDYEEFKLRIFQNALDAFHLCEGHWREAEPIIEGRQAWADGEDNRIAEIYEMGPFQPLRLVIRTRTQLHLTRIALALEGYRTRHGELPTTLAALVNAAPPITITDPFNGEQIRYLVEGQGFLIYSVGPNLIDDGGATYQKRGEQEEKGDLVFEVRR